jgi:hypothetical protein
MDLNSTIDIIIKDLSDVHDIIDDLKSIPGVPALQVELAKAKCKTASDVIALLKNLPQAKVVVKEQVEPKKAAEPAIKSGFTGEKTPSRQTEAPEVSNPVTRTEVSSKKSYEQPIIADQFANRSESFNEKLGGLKHEDDVLEILKYKPVTSLAEAIGVNDKFLFIREIFKGNQEIYNQAIYKLESVANMDDAISIIRDYTGESTENEAVRQLLDLIKRKLPANE